MNSEGLVALAEEHAGVLFAFAYRALGDRGKAEDLVQEVLLRAWRTADRFDPEKGSLRTWLFAIARNLAIDNYRAEASRPQVAGDVEVLAEAVAPDELDRALQAWQMVAALERLSPDHRTVLVQTYYAGRSVAEAAATLGIPSGTVKSRAYYALRSLRLVLEEMGLTR